MNSPLPDGVTSVDYHAETNTYRAVFDSTEIAPSVAVTKLLGRICQREPIDFAPLNDVVDPDALDVICTKQDREGDRIVRFQYLDRDVTVKSYGVVAIQALAGEECSERD